MQAAFDYAVTYVHERKQFGQPVGTFQLMQGKIADMYVAMNASRSYVYAVARACDAGHVSRRVRPRRLLTSKRSDMLTSFECRIARVRFCTRLRRRSKSLWRLSSVSEGMDISTVRFSFSALPLFHPSHSLFLALPSVGS